MEDFAWIRNTILLQSKVLQRKQNQESIHTEVNGVCICLGWIVRKTLLYLPSILSLHIECPKYLRSHNSCGTNGQLTIIFSFAVTPMMPNSKRRVKFEWITTIEQIEWTCKPFASIWIAMQTLDVFGWSIFNLQNQQQQRPSRSTMATN